MEKEQSGAGIREDQEQIKRTWRKSVKGRRSRGNTERDGEMEFE